MMLDIYKKVSLVLSYLVFPVFRPNCMCLFFGLLHFLTFNTRIIKRLLLFHSHNVFSSLLGVISLSRSLHGKANSVIPMVISARDGGGLTAPVNARVNISVVGGSVAPPVFEQAQYFFTVSEDVLRGTEVGVVRASSRNGEFQLFPCALFLELPSLCLKRK